MRSFCVCVNCRNPCLRPGRERGRERPLRAQARGCRVGTWLTARVRVGGIRCSCDLPHSAVTSREREIGCTLNTSLNAAASLQIPFHLRVQPPSPPLLHWSHKPHTASAKAHSTVTAVQPTSAHCPSTASLAEQRPGPAWFLPH